jgi:molybdenum cofactor synthesis domain-containing protein
MSVDIEIISVGNELLIGKIQNTNAYWLAKQATQLGANVNRITVIQDLIDEIGKCVCETIDRRPQFIITTGGLGPTFDDKTLQGIAKALNRNLEINSEALEMIKQKFAEYAKKRQLPAEVELTAPRIKMATFPQATEVVKNPVGMAPGLQVDVGRTVLFALPGVPKEMEAIFTETIAPLIEIAVGDGVFCEKSIFVDNMGESYLSPLIDKAMADNKGIYIKSHVCTNQNPIPSKNKLHLELHLTLRARKQEDPQGRLLKAVRELACLVEANGGKAII